MTSHDRTASAVRARQRRPRGRPRADASVDEAAFLDAALRAFAVHGYAGVSVRTLSKEMGVSHGWVPQRYRTKAGLWYAAVDHAFGRQAAALAFDLGAGDPLEQLESVLKGFLHYSARHPELLLLMNAEGTQDTERLDHIYNNFIGPSLAVIDQLLRSLIDERRVRPVSKRTLFLLVAHGATAPFGLVPLARRLGRSDPLRDKNVETHIEVVTRIVIEGIRLQA